MDPTLHQTLTRALHSVIGFIYPNEIELQWSVLIAVYPYITGLVAGAFIVASLKRVFTVQAITPIYRLSLLTALSFLIVAPMPLLAHLGHPERAFEVLFTPHFSSPMAMFGFVYAWYLMVVLLLEIWYTYRIDLVHLSRTKKGVLGKIYGLLTLGATDTSEEARKTDNRMEFFITVVGIPSGIFLHGYVGFIFGSIKANPWWGSVLLPVIFIFSAVVSGIALMLVLYMATSWIRKVPVQLTCVEALGKFLFYALIVDFGLESLDWIHKLYESEESIDILKLLVSGKLYISLIFIQVIFGTLIPLLALGWAQLTRLPEHPTKEREVVREAVYGVSAFMVLIGVFAVRWNVVIGGQLFSKSLSGLSTYKLDLIGREGALVALIFLVLPFFILWGMTRFLPPWPSSTPGNK